MDYLANMKLVKHIFLKRINLSQTMFLNYIITEFVSLVIFSYLLVMLPTIFLISYIEPLLLLFCLQLTLYQLHTYTNDFCVKLLMKGVDQNSSQTIKGLNSDVLVCEFKAICALNGFSHEFCLVFLNLVNGGLCLILFDEQKWEGKNSNVMK